MSSDSRDDAIRDAKRYVRDVVRNDWSFEFSAKPGAPPPTYPANPDPTEVREWRLREFDSSGSELEPQFSPIMSPSPHDGGDVSCSSGALISVSSAAGTRRTERRRKRHSQMEEEMSWNEGLRTWAERRDAWSGARSSAQVRTWEQSLQPLSTGDGELQGNTAALNTDAESIPASATSRPIAVPATGESSNLASRTEVALHLDKEDGEQPHHDHDNEPADHLSPDENPQVSIEPTDAPPLSADIPPTSPSAATTTTSINSTDPFHDPLIPVVPSLISTSNSIRASITPAMYPSIYSKVVIQGLTPTVPINLADMTKAMVQGWKADGQWPPKPQNLVLQDDATVRPSYTSATKHPDTPAIPPTADKDPNPNPPSSPESKRRSGIASTVRKVLHFGFHPHLHRRGSSSQQNSHPEDLVGAGGDASINTEQADK
ncbi:hypothetical protein BDW59DRAFT_146470 [Aspergillus cavernicola]|uniref:Gag1-like clamp domain-containing protein n=1 Tax=Aspergillus cavernicola TaxID=176166 RepID=A0ABR4IBM5_9EURO